jgi:subfamily B ATP-binding cassette protein MsbA
MDTLTKRAAKKNTLYTALMLGIRAMNAHRLLAALFIGATLAQGIMQGLLVWSLRGILLTFSETETLTIFSLIWASATVLTVWLLRSATAFAADVVSQRLTRRVEIESMEQILQKLLTLPMRFFDKSSHGNTIISTYFDLKGVRNVTLQVGALILNLSTLVGLGVAAWAMSPKLAVIGLATVPLGSLPAYWLGQKITGAADKERTATATLYDSFLQVASGIRVIKVNQSEKRVQERSVKIGRDVYHQVILQTQSRGLARFFLESVSGLGLIFVLVIGGDDIAAGTLEWQSLLGLLIAIMAVYAPILGLLQTYTTIKSVLPSLDSVDRILQAPAAVGDRPNAQPLAEAPRRIELENVSFKYEDKLVLDSLSATFYQGETIGIVGPSGTGKSTLIAVLLRFYDATAGRILLDGVDLRDIRYSDYMSKCAIVMQEPFVFIDTIANNIRIARPDANLEDVIEAAKAANIHDEIMQMEHGYDTIIGHSEDSRGISVGQKQRICIAAALLKNAPILFLDEATSNLDSISERKVQAAIERLMDGRTTFAVAHRLSTLRNADRILVIDRGHIVGLGKHDELLKFCPTYRTLCSSQFNEFNVEGQEVMTVHDGAYAMEALLD